MNDEFKLIIVIPCYRHAHTLAGNISLLKKHNLPILIVDDGNTTPQSDILKKLEDENIILIRNDKNMGKGYSVTKGFLEAPVCQNRTACPHMWETTVPQCSFT